MKIQISEAKSECVAKLLSGNKCITLHFCHVEKLFNKESLSVRLLSSLNDSRFTVRKYDNFSHLLCTLYLVARRDTLLV